jgi:hypothetical protein
MNTLTQVWVLSIALCSVILVSTFKLAGRLGLFVGFILSLVVIYLLLHKGLKLFLDQINSKLHKGSDPTGFNQLIFRCLQNYPIQQYYLHYTTEPTHPLVWRNFKNDIHLVVNKDMVENLDSDEKIILAHLLLSHGSVHSNLDRRLFSILFLSLRPISRFLAPLFNSFGVMLKFKKQIFKADLLALKNSNSLTPDMRNDFSLFLRKLHNYKFHRLKYYRGENFFSILSTSSPSFFSLRLTPSLDVRLKNLMGDFIKK